MNVILTTFLSLSAATILAALGFLKNKQDEDFQPEKLVATYLAAIFVAVLAVLFEVPMETGEALFYYFIVQSGAIVYIERILKFVWRTYILPHIPE